MSSASSNNAHSDPVAFYKGEVTHQRFSGPAHRLRYRTAYVLVDLDQFQAADACSRFLGVGAAGLMSVQARDHGDGKTRDLAGWVRALARASGVSTPCHRIMLLTLPRMFGFVFNPISTYFIYDQYGSLHHIVYEVNNTFGGRHFYLLAAEERDGVIRQSCDKALYVSPFFDVNGSYAFTVHPPSDRLTLTINYAHPDHKKAMSACLVGKRRPVTNRSSLGVLFAFPFMTLGVIGAIHWEAFKLFLKGARFRPEPKGRDFKKRSHYLSTKEVEPISQPARKDLIGRNCSAPAQTE